MEENQNKQKPTINAEGKERKENGEVSMQVISGIPYDLSIPFDGKIS